MDQLIAGATLVTPNGCQLDGWLLVRGDRIADLGTGAPPRTPDVQLDGGWLTPGFVDVHSHGGGGASVVGADPEAVARFASTHLQHGTTTIQASLVSAAPEPLARDVAGLADLVDDGIVVGIHLEGPWISAAHCGAHDPTVLRDPGAAELDNLLRLGRGSIRMVTLAPERPGGLAAVERIADAGAVPAIGHTDASYETVRQAIDAGAACATHLFNAMRPAHHREPGPVVALTEDPRVACELVLDGVHLHPATAAYARRAAAGPIVLVTDAMSAAGGPDGVYPLGELTVDVVDGVARLATNGAIAGSTLTLDAAVRFAVQQAGFSLSEAITAAATAPADMLGLPDRGRLVAGARADLCHLDDDLRLTGVWQAGRRVEAA